MPDETCRAEALRLRTLQRIADALGISTASLQDSEVDQHAASALRTEVAAMLSAFMQIRDPNRRRACLDFATSLADGSGAAGEARPDPDDEPQGDR